MQLAETLGIAAEDVHPQVADTDSVGYTDVTGGSRVTFATGLAAYQVGLDIREQMAERAALLWECEPERGRVRGRHVPCAGGKVDLVQGTGRQAATRPAGPIVGRAAVDPKGRSNGFGTHIVDVEVDPDTGKVTILRYTAIQDVGKAIHPSYVEGQMQGGSVQGIGWALNEEYFYDDQGPDAQRQLSRLSHAHGVRSADDRHDHCRGAQPGASVWRARRGRNADRARRRRRSPTRSIDAIGVRMPELPMSPPKVWAAMRDAK